MKILHRYVLREHVGPLLFALSALTAILLLQYVGKNIGNLVGKGLSSWVIVEFFALSIPLTIALTLPMAVLVATLYAFSRLAAENEITALKASGVGLGSVLTPVLWAAAGVTLLMIGFNDQVLPRANHRLAILQRDIAQKKPTFGLREQVINEVSPGKFYLRAGHLDESSNRMREITIYDMGDPTRRRTIYADSGNMAMSRGMTDLELTLYNGNMQDIPTSTPTQLQRLYFTTDFIRMRGVGNEFEKTAGDTYKGNREMTICEMHLAEKRARQDYINARNDFLQAKKVAVAQHYQISETARKANLKQPVSVDLSGLYCQLVNLVRPKAAHAQSPAPAASSTPSIIQRYGARIAPSRVGSSTVPAIAGARSFNPAGATASSTASSTASTTTASSQPGAANSELAVQVDATNIRLMETREMLDELSVEINKKFALAVACFVFVLLGAPIALRFPRGGVGLTIGVSLVVFALYYVALIGGEALGKRGIIPPAISMWMANVVFAALALWLLARMSTQSATARGGDAREMFDSMKGWFRNKLGIVGLERRRSASR